VRSTFPVEVSLNRLATDLRVLLRAMGFGMRKGQKLANPYALAIKTLAKRNQLEQPRDRMFALLRSRISDLMQAA
jgi:hypothetical protein